MFRLPRFAPRLEGIAAAAPGVMQPDTPQPNSLSLSFLEEVYEEYLQDPGSIDLRWRDYFDGLTNGSAKSMSRFRTGPSFDPGSLFNNGGNGNGSASHGDPSREGSIAALQHRVDQLIRNYRVRGHMSAQIDPLGMPRPEPREIETSYYNFTEEDLDRPFSTESMVGADLRTLRHIIEKLRNTYCRSIGVLFMHIDSLAVRTWLQDRMEGSENRIDLTRDEQIRILTRLTDAVIFEEFIRKKFTGAKSFSLEGGESLIPLLDLAIEKAGTQGIEEIVLGMAHRGRLNVLANVMGKNPKAIFREFEDADPDLHIGRGDVKYHLGYSSDWTTQAGKRIHLSLCFNPSHLEYVNTVALGRMRAKQDRVNDEARQKGLVLLIHGDAAFAGEGIIQETLNLSQLDPYVTGGTLHVIVNNQLGFTTPPEAGRSMTYASSVGKMLQSPIFLVNGEDPEAVAQVVRLAMDFRHEFKRDVIIDMYCYRRLGHNEGDEPAFTQPVLYRAIEKRKSVREGYLEHLLKLNGVTSEEAQRIAEERYEHLEKELSAARSDTYVHTSTWLTGAWNGYVGGPESAAPEVDTGVDPARLADLGRRLTNLPVDFHLHPKLGRILEARREMAEGKAPLDWATAESLAFASLATQGHRIRMTGQDCERGTFSHRHSVLHDYEDGRRWFPLAHLAPEQAPVEIHNSPLSEAGVMGFEYGYSLDCPEGLVLWEAQFGDFCNAAQVIIDQFIASAEDKWHRLSGLVLLLPHGFEGQGPEHSSARLERFLVLASEYNIQIANPTTPAQYFHLLRRQVLRKWRKPLVVMTPKGLLRHTKSTSPIEDFANGTFQRILPDVRQDRKEVERIILCSGRVYFDLADEREKLGREDVAILRLEQLYPLSEETLRKAFSPYPEGTHVFWVQEEPENMGGWRYLRTRFGYLMLGRYPFSGVSRAVSASPATGSASSHRVEQRRLMEKAFSDLPD